MRIEVTGRQLEVTSALRSFVEEKISKLKRFIDEIEEVHVILAVEKYRQIAEITVKTRHFVLTGKEETSDMYTSISQTVDKLEKQAKRTKEKVIDRKRKEERVEAVEGETSLNPPQIIKMNQSELKPMTVEEAALKFSLSRNDFLVFKNSENGKVNVIYRLADGNLGLITPEG
jgi:putative sigma-54 modulation protein